MQRGGRYLPVFFLHPSLPLPRHLRDWVFRAIISAKAEVYANITAEMDVSTAGKEAGISIALDQKIFTGRPAHIRYKQGRSSPSPATSAIALGHAFVVTRLQERDARSCSSCPGCQETPNGDPCVHCASMLCRPAGKGPRAYPLLSWRSLMLLAMPACPPSWTSLRPVRRRCRQRSWLLYYFEGAK